MKLKDLKQEKDYTCGPAVMRAWIALRSDKKIPKEKTVEVKAKTTKTYGTTPENLLTYAKEKGYNGTILTTDKIKKFDIFLVQEDGYGHWLIATNVAGDYISYFDPWTGKTTNKNKSKFDFNAKVKDKIHKNCVIRLK